jgi:hypothetical protein
VWWVNWGVEQNKSWVFLVEEENLEESRVDQIASWRFGDKVDPFALGEWKAEFHKVRKYQVKGKYGKFGGAGKRVGYEQQLALNKIA